MRVVVGQVEDKPEVSESIPEETGAIIHLNKFALLFKCQPEGIRYKYVKFKPWTIYTNWYFNNETLQEKILKFLAIIFVLPIIVFGAWVYALIWLPRENKKNDTKMASNSNK